MKKIMKKVKKIFDAQEFNYKMKNDSVLITGFGLKTYENMNGENHITMALRVDEEEQTIIFIIPQLYYYQGDNKAVFTILLDKQRERKSLVYDYDPSDGEIRIIVEMPVKNKEQLEQDVMTMLERLLFNVDDIHPKIAAAIQPDVFTLTHSDDKKVLAVHEMPIMLKKLGIDEQESKALLKAFKKDRARKAKDRELVKPSSEVVH